MEDLNVEEVRKVLKDVRGKIDLAISEKETLSALLIRFAWHCSGTYDKFKRNGGSNGSTMRFKTEQEDPENQGFANAMELYNKIKAEHPEISYADLFILGAYVALEWTGGPKIPFSFGRKDLTEEQAEALHGKGLCPFGDGEYHPKKSRLPSADLGKNPHPRIDFNDPNIPMSVKEKPTIDAMRRTFTRMGFDDKETVALIVLGHQFGRCHPCHSGYNGFWYAFAPYDWNVYAHGFGYLSVYDDRFLDRYEEKITSKGKRQYEMNFGGQKWMMLITDMCLYWDEEYRKHLDFYQVNRITFKKEAAAAFKKLTELGCDGILTPEIP